jgi:hypothetical protein
MAAEYCMTQFMNHFGRYSKLKDDPVTNDKQKYFMIDERVILGICDKTTSTPAVEITVRDSTGKYGWRMYANYYDLLAQKTNNTITSNDPPYLSLNIPSHLVDTMLITIPTSSAYNNSDLPTLENLGWKFDSINRLMRQEINLISKSASSTCTKQEPTKSRVDGKSAFRLLLSQLGFFLPENMKRISLLSTQHIRSELDALDQLSE